MKLFNLVCATTFPVVAVAQSEHAPVARPDAHAPISIMGDHTHNAGEVMLSYRYMHMDMGKMYQGSDTISSAGVFAENYIISPERMSMRMQMLGAMYAPTDRVTLSAMLPYSIMEMDHRIAPGAAPLIGLNGGKSTFTTNSDGVGDLKLGSLFRIVHEGPHHFHGGLGISLPTGSISENDVVPGPGGRIDRQLPATMQPGSGTFDILPSLTYSHVADGWSAGVQAGGIVRTGKNSHDYRLGDRFDLSSWFSYVAADWVSLSTGVSYVWDGEMHGTQADLLRVPPFAPAMHTVPTAFSENYGGQKIEALFGVNFIVPSGPLVNNRIAVDLRLPLWQDRNGLSLGTDYTLALGWQYAF